MVFLFFLFYILSLFLPIIALHTTCNLAVPTQSFGLVNEDWDCHWYCHHHITLAHRYHHLDHHSTYDFSFQVSHRSHLFTFYVSSHSYTRGGGGEMNELSSGSVRDWIQYEKRCLTLLQQDKVLTDVISKVQKNAFLALPCTLMMHACNHAVVQFLMAVKCFLSLLLPLLSAPTHKHTQAQLHLAVTSWESQVSPTNKNMDGPVKYIFSLSILIA